MVPELFMSSPSGGSWPGDLTGLARIAADLQRPNPERERALLELRPFHLQTARRLLRRRMIRDPARLDDLVAHVEMRLWEGAFPPTHGSYPAWCRTVLAHELSSMGRRVRREEALPEGALPAPDSLGGAAAEDRRLDWEAPFSQADLERIRAWRNPLRRIVLLCRGLLWHKVPL